jgi:hypothetical protein
MGTSWKFIVVGLASTVPQFGLAVLAGGGWTRFFGHPALVALAWVTVAMMIVAPFTSGNTSSDNREREMKEWISVIR